MSDTNKELRWCCCQRRAVFVLRQRFRRYIAVPEAAKASGTIPLITGWNHREASSRGSSSRKRPTAQKTRAKPARLIRAPAARAFRIASIVARSRKLPYATVSL